MTSPVPSRARLVRDLVLAVALQLGLARLLSRACTTAEEREVWQVDHPHRLRRQARRAA